jgi:hypothetical protein
MKRSGWIDVMASGHVVLRAEIPGSKLLEGALPCYDAGNATAARNLVVFACELARDGTGYHVPGFVPDNLESIVAAKARFAALHAVMKSRRSARLVKNTVQRASDVRKAVRT